MTSPLQIIRPHQAAYNVDLVENQMVPSIFRQQNMPMIDVPGRDVDRDNLVSPLTAMHRYNPYNGVLTGNKDNLNNFVPSLFTYPQTVDLYLTNSFGSGGAYLTAPLYASEQTSNADSSQWNVLWQTPMMRKQQEFVGLGGVPTKTQLRDSFERDTIHKDFRLTIGFDKDRPVSSDFEQSFRVTINPGETGSYEPGQACSCKMDSSFGLASLQAIALSSANFERLYLMMRDADLLGPIKAMIIYEGRNIPCLCSWITPGYANRFVGFTMGMNTPANQELDMNQTLNTINTAFINKLYGAIMSNQELAKRTYHRRFLGPAIGLTLPPMDAAMETLPSKQQVAEQLGELSSTNYLKIDGPGLFTDLKTAAAAHQLSRPRATGFNDDMYLLTGMDFRHQVELVYSGAVSTDLVGGFDIPLATAVLEASCRDPKKQLK